MTNINLQIQEIQQTPSVVNLKKSTPRHIIVKMLKAKKKEILEISNRKMTYTREQKCE